jgi:hypothetical protein
VPENQQSVLLAISDCLGIHDPDELYTPAMIVIELIVTILVCQAIIKLWWHYWTKRKNTNAAHS